jgi:uncharacterized protein (TIGR02147 family)
MISLPDFKDSANWISRRLRNKITPEQARQAVSTMIRLGVLKRHPDSQHIFAAKTSLMTSEDIPSDAIRSHHRQMLERAFEALEEQDVLNREFTSATLAFDRKDIAEAKTMIRDFRDKFHKRFETKHANSVFQMNMAFFEHTIQNSKTEVL